MAAPEWVDVHADRGDTNVYDITAKNADGSAMNLTGASMWFTVKKNHIDPDAAALVQKTIGAGITVISAGAGTAQVVIAPADTDAVTPGRYYYDVQVKEGSGRITTIERGYFHLDATYTRAT